MNLIKLSLRPRVGKSIPSRSNVDEVESNEVLNFVLAIEHHKLLNHLRKYSEINRFRELKFNMYRYGRLKWGTVHDSDKYGEFPKNSFVFSEFFKNA